MMGCTLTEVDDRAIAEAGERVCPEAVRFAVRTWNVVGSPAESTVTLHAEYQRYRKSIWKPIATAPDRRQLFGRLLLMNPVAPPWK